MKAVVACAIGILAATAALFLAFAWELGRYCDDVFGWHSEDEE